MSHWRCSKLDSIDIITRRASYFSALLWRECVPHLFVHFGSSREEIGVCGSGLWVYICFHIILGMPPYKVIEFKFNIEPNITPTSMDDGAKACWWDKDPTCRTWVEGVNLKFNIVCTFYLLVLLNMGWLFKCVCIGLFAPVLLLGKYRKSSSLRKMEHRYWLRWDEQVYDQKYIPYALHWWSVGPVEGYPSLFQFDRRTR